MNETNDAITSNATLENPNWKSPIRRISMPLAWSGACSST